MAERRYYVSWADKRTDPFPQHELIPDTADELELRGSKVRVLPGNHAEWPGVPLVAGADQAFADARMGRYLWPGFNYPRENPEGRLYLGPTLSALFHPQSPLQVNDFDRIYLLHPAAEPPDRLQRLCKALARVRSKGRDKLDDRFTFVPVEGIEDPTHHESILKGVEEWARGDPFDFGRKAGARVPARITIHLGCGTPAMHLCWVLLRWNGKLLRGGKGIVEFVQGDSGLRELGEGDSPLKRVEIDRLAQFTIPAQAAQPQVRMDARGVSLADIQGPPFDVLRQRIDQAALLGLPILLNGKRGTGKTWLARYYHLRRKHHRRSVPEHLKVRAKGKVDGGTWLPRQAQTDGPPFVSVTLSEFAELEKLRDTLFGWAEKSWTGAGDAYDGLLGEAHGGTLFLDEIHHLSKSLQAALLAPLNNRHYRPMMATYEIVSYFDLVVATNDPQWRDTLADDFRDRIERIVIEVPAFQTFQRSNLETLWKFWDCTIHDRCEECGIQYTQEGDWDECTRKLRSLFQHHPLPGNWRDLQRLADNLLLTLAAARDGNPPTLTWHTDQLEHAIGDTFGEL